MFKKARFLGKLAGFGLVVGALLGAISPLRAAESHSREIIKSTPFQRIEQPLSNKMAITLGGLGLIGLELWWFLLSKPKSRQATTLGGIQEVTITVDGGYEPSQITVQVGQPVRLNFYRKDASSCLEEVRLPDFHIARELPLNQTTPVEFMPDKPGNYEFTCGMNMFRGRIEVQSAEVAVPTPPITPSQPITLAESSISSVEAIVTPEGIQEATVMVEKGYQPKRVIVETGYPVRLHFQRNNPNKCYDQLLIPDFDVAVDLAPDKITTVELTPEHPGEYEFMCGMKMNRGVIEVRSHQLSNLREAVRTNVRA